MAISQLYAGSVKPKLCVCGVLPLNHKVSAQDAALPRAALTCCQEPDRAGHHAYELC